MKKPAVILFYFHEIEFPYKFISSLPKNRLDDVIFARAKLSDKFLGLNLVDSTGIEDIENTGNGIADSILKAGKSTGVEIENKLTGVMQTLLLSSNTSLDHYMNVLDRDDSIGRSIRREALKKTDNKFLRNFIQEIEQKSINLSSIHNKFKNLFSSKEMTAICSYIGPTLFTYKDIIENGKILIYYLGGIGHAGTAIASMELCRIYNHFFKYSDIDPTPFYPTFIVIDEIQRVRTLPVLELIKEQRKHGARIIGSTQTMETNDPSLKQCVDLCGNILVFQSPESDVRFFVNKASGIVKGYDIESLDKFQMFIRNMSSKNIAKCNTIPFFDGDKSKVEYVLKNSYDKYYFDFEEHKKFKKEHEVNILKGGRPEKVKELQPTFSGFSDELSSIIKGKA